MRIADARVLLVDDDPQIVELYERYLEDAGSVLTAEGGTEALELIDESVDVVLLDRRMPDLSGDEVLDTIRERGYQCPVVMVTAVDADFDVTRMPCHAYLTKPVSREEIRDVVDHALDISTRDVRLQEYFAAVARRNAIREEKTETELEASEEYAELEERIASLREEVGLDDPFEPVDAFDSSLSVSVSCDECGERFDPDAGDAMRRHLREEHGIDPA